MPLTRMVLAAALSLQAVLQPFIIDLEIDLEDINNALGNISIYLLLWNELN